MFNDGCGHHIRLLINSQC